MSEILRRAFGATGESVPALSAGCGPFRVDSAADHIAAVRRAVELGMNYFDTAPDYGEGESQQVLGRALAEIAEPVFVATKVGHLPGRSQHRDADAILAQVHENLRILGRDHVDLLQIHEADWRGWWADDGLLGAPVDPDEDLDYADAPVMHAMTKAREQGLCRFIGITGNTSALTAHVLTHVDIDAVLFAYTYNLIWRDAVKHAIPTANQRKVACIIAGPLYNGRLAAARREWLDDPPAWLTPDIRALYEQLCDIQEEFGIPMPELAIRYVIGDPRISTVLTASITVDEVQQNVSAATAGPLPGDLYRRLSQIGLDGPEVHPWLFDFWRSM
jgi:aryl-alcohol dehydrogenase-like predicted oxidoreductase